MERNTIQGVIDPRLGIGSAAAVGHISTGYGLARPRQCHNANWGGHASLRLLGWAWSRNPLAIAFFVFAIDFGVLLAIRMWEHGAVYMPWGNRTFTIGDSVFLPAYAGMAALSFRNQPQANALFRSKGWHAAVICGGVALAVGLDLIAVGTGHTSVFAEFRLSKTYHTAIVPVLVYLLVSVLPLHFTRRSAASTLALVALACYLSISLMEIHVMARTSVEVAAARFTGPFSV